MSGNYDPNCKLPNFGLSSFAQLIVVKPEIDLC